MQRSTNPNPCLIAILLIVRSSSGVNFVFHYPPKPKSTPTHTPARRHSQYAAYTISGTSSPSSPSTSGSSDDDADDRQSRTTARGRTATERSDSGSKTRSRRRQHVKDEDEGDGKGGDEKGEAMRVLGFKEEFLAGLLAPKERMCRAKFELSIDDMVFLGYPLHVRPDGTWRKQKKKRGRGRSGSGGGDDDGNVGVEGNPDAGGIIIGNGGHEDDADDEKDDEDGESSQGGNFGNMTMFHVVFVLNPPELEYHSRTQEMFDYVVKRFARALKYEQAKDGYVWGEAEKIVRLKDKANHEGTSFADLWRDILDQSSLAYAISRIYIDISQSKIAHVFLNNNLGLSLQMPIISEISVMPSITEPQVPGLPLTTANSFGDDDAEGDNMLAKHFTLLFLEDVNGILKDIAAEATDSSASLARFVEACRPTKSFLQISNSCGIPLHEIQVMARHLVHWRKARAIPPIHQRDTYIVSPNADMKKLHTLIPIYNTLFPTLQPLPKLLTLLSSKPKPFSAFIPSRAHRPAYLEILAFLIRHGLATQLRNFAWLRVTRQIKRAVAAEERAKKSPADPPLNSQSQEKEKERERERERDLTKMTSSISSLLSHKNDSDSEDEYEDSIILEPHQASSIESSWLEMMTRDQPPDIKALFDRIIKYLNGQHAIENIAVREGIARKDVGRVLGVFDGFVIYARHW
ncbi:nitrogen permease regulator of amino acid transport activity 3-domain-containing protein [Tuber indicum]|nr:nitrogen permease regulator of amino acid transport activity 3-domain-containing protein [Tuber indicum]